jgi:multicomponent Na+:H+ antiporter subunit G
MTDIIIYFVVTLGAVFVFLAAVGILRMPDLFLRISVTTKAATLGVGLLLLGTALYFNEISTTTRTIAIIIFLFLTAPIGAHLIGRASYFTGVPLWKNSKIDELKGKYDKDTHGLRGDE